MEKFNVIYRETAMGAPKQGEFEGVAESILRRDLEARGWRILVIQQLGSRGIIGRIKKMFVGKLSFSFRMSVSTSELALLCEVFKALYTSGVQMLQIVQMTIEETPNPWLQKKLVIVLEHLRVGDDLYTSMSDPRCRRAFPPIMCETIRTGEINGRLDQSLGRLVDTFKRAAETKRETISALMYPMFALVVFFVVGTVISIKIPNVLEEIMGQKEMAALYKRLPTAIRTLFFLRNNPVYLIFPPCFIAGMVFLWGFGKRFHATRIALTRVERKVPMLGSLLYQFALVRFLDLLAANHETGIQVAESLRLIKGSVGDALIEDSVMRIRENILATGMGLSAALSTPDEEEVYPGLVRQMIRAGEESGRLTEMLQPIVVFYDGQAKALLKRLMDMMTPLMIIMLGCLIGPVVIGVYKTLILLTQAAASG